MPFTRHRAHLPGLTVAACRRLDADRRPGRPEVITRLEQEQARARCALPLGELLQLYFWPTNHANGHAITLAISTGLAKSMPSGMVMTTSHRSHRACCRRCRFHAPASSSP